MAQVIRLELLQMLKITYIVSPIRTQITIANLNIVVAILQRKEHDTQNMTSYVQLLGQIITICNPYALWNDG